MIHKDVAGPVLRSPTEAIERELQRAEQLYEPIHNVHEGYAIIKEELDEFWDECRRKPYARSKERMAHELIQVAAMAVRTLKDCC